MDGMYLSSLSFRLLSSRLGGDRMYCLDNGYFTSSIPMRRVTLVIRQLDEATSVSYRLFHQDSTSTWNDTDDCQTSLTFVPLRQHMCQCDMRQD